MTQTLQASDLVSVEVAAGVWQGLSDIVARSVSPLDIQTTAQIVGQWQMALAAGQKAAIDAKTPALSTKESAE